jgi:hypothetical protein
LEAARRSSVCVSLRPAASSGRRAGTLLFATNAGMFDPVLKPVGLCKQWPSAPGTAFMHNGNGLNMVYVDPENDLVAVVRWIDNNAVDGFLKRLIAAVAEKSRGTWV